MGTGCRHVQSDEISHTAGFVNCFQTVPEAYLPHCMVGRLFSASTKTDRQKELNEKSLAGNKFLLLKIFAPLHLRALPEIFVLHYYFSPGNASV